MSNINSVQQVGFGWAGKVDTNLSSNQQNLNAAATYWATSFICDRSEQVSKIKVYVSSVTGTVGSSDLRCDIYSDSGGAPSSSLANTSTVTAAPTGAQWVEFTGFSYTLTEGTQYWIVVRNLNATPASNYPTLRTIVNYANTYGTSGLSTWGFSRKVSTDSGATWATVTQASFAARIEFNNGTFFGFPVESVASTTAASGERVYASRELGVKFTTPANASLKVIGVAMRVGKTGSPTGDCRFRIYQDTTLVATTGVVPLGNITSGVLMYPLYFTSTQSLSASTSYRVVISETTNSDASTNYYYTTKMTWENNANSLNLKPMNGTLQRTYYDGSSWTDTSTEVCEFMLILDPSGEFASTGSGATNYAYF